MSRKTKTSRVALDPQVAEIEYEATVEDYLGDYDEQLQEPPAVRPYAHQPRRRARKQALSAHLVSTPTARH
nr:hypothetical protein [uncultured Pseudogulbenkiania sp.]